jgi:hypothetical protein
MLDDLSGEPGEEPGKELATDDMAPGHRPVVVRRVKRHSATEDHEPDGG